MLSKQNKYMKVNYMGYVGLYFWWTRDLQHCLQRHPLSVLRQQQKTGSVKPVEQIAYFFTSQNPVAFFVCRSIVCSGLFFLSISDADQALLSHFTVFRAKNVRKLFAIQEILRSPLGVFLFLSTKKKPTPFGFCVIYRLIRMMRPTDKGSCSETKTDGNGQKKIQIDLRLTGNMSPYNRIKFTELSKCM